MIIDCFELVNNIERDRQLKRDLEGKATASMRIQTGLFACGTPLIILLFVLAIVNDGVAVTIRTLAVPLGLFVAFLLSHLAIRRLAPNADPAILPISFMLSGIGIAFVMRLAPELAERQILWLFLAVAAMVLTLIAVPSIHRLSNYKYTIMIIGIILLLLPALIGTEHYGSKIWLTWNVL